MSSKTTAKVRPVRFSGRRLVETRGFSTFVSAGAGFTSTRSKLTMAWGVPSSETVRSACVRSETAPPFLSITTRSTMT